MIKKLENALTRIKHTVNFIDQNGKVIGFNPTPDGIPIEWKFVARDGDDVPVNSMVVDIDDFLSDENFMKDLHFGFMRKANEVNTEGASTETMQIEFLYDDTDELVWMLEVNFENNGYYSADFTITTEDKLRHFNRV